MNHLKDFFVIVSIWDGLATKDTVIPAGSEIFVALYSLQHYTKRDALQSVFETISKNKENYFKPIFSRCHDMMVAIKTGAFTVCLDLLNKTDWNRYLEELNSGLRTMDTELIKTRESLEEQHTTTLIVSHMWDDDPNNGVQDFTSFDFVFMIDLGIGAEFTSVYNLPLVIGLDVQFLRYDSSFTIRDIQSSSLSRVSFYNKYERWIFQIEREYIDKIDSDANIETDYGYVTLTEANRIVNACIAEKDVRRDENHQMLRNLGLD